MRREMSAPPASSSLAARRVAVLHNRYRTGGGEERYVDQLVRLLARRAAAVDVVESSSGETCRLRAGGSLVRGGLGAQAQATAGAVAANSADVLHAHNIHPAFGWRALAAGRRAGAATVLHLHNYRLFCAIGIAFRDGHDCFACARRRTWNGMTRNCRENAAEAIAYAVGIGAWQRRLIAAVDVFVSPTRQLADDLAGIGFDLPVEVVTTWLPNSEFARRTAAGSGTYALLAGRVAREKGVLVAIEAAAVSGVPLKIAGDGPDLPRARELAERLHAPVEFTGRLDGEAMSAIRSGASFALLPSIWREVLPFAALEAQAVGLPLIVSDRGGLPELTDADLVVPPNDAPALAAVMKRLHENSAERETRGNRALERARGRFSEAAFESRIAEVYELAVERRASADVVAT